MPYRKEQFDNGDVAHITLRAIDGNLLFKDVDDYYRGIFSIYEFNNSNPVTIRKRREIRNALKNKINRGRASADSIVDEREKLVEILAFCFMNNHIHLLIRQLQDNGIVKFMSKIGTGLGGYFNRKNQRKGHVFQDRFYAVKVKDDTQLKIATVYIHTNPLSLFFPNWKKIRIDNINEAIDFLDNKYKWFSHPDYIGNKNFPSIIEREFILKLFGGAENYKEFVKSWIQFKGNPKSTEDGPLLILNV